MARNDNLHKAKKAKNDEFYTRYEDIEEELKHYDKDKFHGKIVYCNCDNPKYSNFWKYFHEHFSEYKLKRLVATYYDEKNPVYKCWYEGGNDSDSTIYEKELLEGNGDFRSDECVKILEESDMIITNPPFSLFREFVALIMKYNN